MVTRRGVANRHWNTLSHNRCKSPLRHIQITKNQSEETLAQSVGIQVHNCNSHRQICRYTSKSHSQITLNTSFLYHQHITPRQICVLVIRIFPQPLWRTPGIRRQLLLFRHCRIHSQYHLKQKPLRLSILPPGHGILRIRSARTNIQQVEARRLVITPQPAATTSVWTHRMHMYYTAPPLPRPRMTFNLCNSHKRWSPRKNLFRTNH